MDNKTLVNRFFKEIVNSKKTELIEEMFHPQYVNHGFPVEAKGFEAERQITALMFSAFPDLLVNLEDSICEGDTVASRGYWTGTHKGDFMGLAATGRKVNVPFISVWNIKNGKLHEDWIQMDSAGLMRQLS